MTRKLATLLCLLSAGAGMTAGLYVKQNALQNAVILANARGDYAALVAVETVRECARMPEFRR